MVDITAKLFWYRSKEWCSAMADKLADIVYTDESKETIDVINLLLLGWILLGLVVYIIGNVIATYLRKRKSLVSRAKPETPTAADDTVPCANDVPKSREDVHELVSQTLVPTCEGDDEEFSKWVNGVISWIYTQRVVSPVIDSWLSALNARTRLSSTEHGILVDFRDLLHTSGPPKVTEVRQNTYSRYDNTGLTCDMEFENIAFEMIVTQFKEKEKILLPFVLQVKRLYGKVAVECNPEDVSFMAKYSEPPQIDLYPEASNDIELPQEDYQPLCDLVSEIASDALTHALVPLRLSCFPNCPRLLPNTPEDVFVVAESETERRLLVKVVKATNLGGSKGCLKPYCVVEMDDPPQRFETQVVEGTHSPFWDEGFTFSIKDPAELLFEIYDKDKGTSEGFLGLGIVGVEELVRNPSQRQIIPLQSRPLEEDNVTGVLTVEFLFLDHTSPVLETTRFGPPLRQEPGGKTVETNSRVTAGGTVITTTTIKRTKEDGEEADLAGTALQQLGKQHTTPSSTSKSTLIIHSVQRPPESSVPGSLGASPAHLSNSYSDPSSPTQESQEEVEGRGRPKEKRSLMGTLRRRLSFHRGRSKSAEEQSRASSRSASTDRIRHPPTPLRMSPFKGRFLGGQLLSPAAAGSTRSSLSEASGISASSAKTYINENSTLVIETNENGIVKRYLIPNSLVHRSKWKKRGTKLHIYNDHVFIAKHLSGSTQCQVCRRHLTRRPGKQGYECRGCDLQCHKSCHVKVENYCSNSSINSMEVEYIHDPKGASPKSI